MKKWLLLLPVFIIHSVSAQPRFYTVANAHSHNDYEQDNPFWKAYHAGFGSVEADIYLQGNDLLVAHQPNEISPDRTLEKLYLDPIQQCIEKNHGYAFADSTRQLQLLIDVKTAALPTLKRLDDILEKYPALIHNPSVIFVISGNRPDPSAYTQYPSYIWFDGRLDKDYSTEALSRIAMLSDDFQHYSHWNGKGVIPAAEKEKLEKVIVKAHALHKTVRFWASPDFINAWYQLMHLHIDYINTDHINELADFLNQLPKHSYTSPVHYPAYTPTYKSDGSAGPVRNIILLIGDGTGWAQLYAGYTANQGQLNIFNMHTIGLSKTSSYDSYITDSAPGSTAFSTGIKTNNRFVGVDHTGRAVPLLPDLLRKKKIRTGIVTCGDITDATPADFYAHEQERDHSLAILKDLKNASVDLLMGSAPFSPSGIPLLKKNDQDKATGNLRNILSPEYRVVGTIDSLPDRTAQKWVVVDPRAGLSMLKGRGDWLPDAFTKATRLLSQNKEGFFLVVEGAQVDYGGHANSVPYVATEVLDFDQTVGRALRFADSNGETLVIVTADHETGGLSLLDGDYTKGYVSGQFSTNDHTALPIPVFAYGPQSSRFRGVYENTGLFSKIMEIMHLSRK